MGPGSRIQCWCKTCWPEGLHKFKMGTYLKINVRKKRPCPLPKSQVKERIYLSNFGSRERKFLNPIWNTTETVVRSSYFFISLQERHLHFLIFNLDYIGISIGAQGQYFDIGQLIMVDRGKHNFIRVFHITTFKLSELSYLR